VARELKIRITGDASGLRNATDDSIGILQGFSSRVSAISVAAGNLLADGVRQGFGAIAGFAKDSVGAASDLNETISKVGVLFGETAPAIEGFASNAAKYLGQSKQQAMDAAATFATFGKSAGLGGIDLANFATQLTGLASDMASFSNTTPEDAIEAIGSALRGEAEPIRRYGVLLDDATLKQQALELGLISTTKEALTPANKVLAAQAAIFKQTEAAQGDFARTSDGLANKQRILAAQVANLKTGIGQAFLPIVLSATTALSTKLLPVLERFGPIIATEIAGGFRAFASAFRAFDGDVTSSGFPGFMERVGYVARLVWERFQELLPTLQAIGGVIAGAAGTAITFLADNWDRIRESLTLVGPPLLAAVAGFQAFAKLTAAVKTVQAFALGIKAIGVALAANPIGLAVAAVAALAAGLYLAYQRSETFRNAVNGLAERFLGFVEGVRNAFGEGGVGAAIAKAWEGIKAGLDSLGGWLTSTALPFLGEKALQLAGVLGGWIATAAGYLRDNLPGWLGSLVEWLVGTALPAVIIEGAKLAATLADWIGDAAVALLKKLPGWLATLATWLATDAIPAVLSFGDDLARNMVDGLIAGLGKLAGKLTSAVGKFIKDNVPGVVADVLGIDSPSKVFAGFGRNIAEGLALGMTGGSSLVASAASGLAATSAYGGPGGFGPAELPGSGRWSASPIVVETYIDGRAVATALAPHQRAVERSKR
jgi:hypothetical protein